jgi:hypothetical protein
VVVVVVVASSVVAGVAIVVVAEMLIQKVGCDIKFESKAVTSWCTRLTSALYAIINGRI